MVPTAYQIVAGTPAAFQSGLISHELEYDCHSSARRRRPRSSRRHDASRDCQFHFAAAGGGLRGRAPDSAHGAQQAARPGQPTASRPRPHRAKPQCMRRKTPPPRVWWIWPRPSTADARLELVTEKDPEALKVVRHSAAHVLATAVLELFPETKLGHGPATDSGFFYDFYREKPFTEEDLAAIEDEDGRGRGARREVRARIRAPREGAEGIRARRRLHEDPLRDAGSRSRARR